MLPTKFQVNWLFGSGEDAKNTFSRWLARRPSWISDWKVFSYFGLQVTPLLPTKLQVNGLSVQEKKPKIDFQETGMAAFLDF